MTKNQSLELNQLSSAYQTIIALMPPHQVYIETHVGQGSVFLTKPPARFSVCLDENRVALTNLMTKAVEQDYKGEFSLVCDDALHFLRDYEFTGAELVYCDPPYMFKTRKSNERYKDDYSDDDHLELISILNSIDAKVILYGYPSRIYEEYLSDWNVHEFQVLRLGGLVTEMIWFNYEPEIRLLDGYSNENIKHKQQITEIASDWVNNYKKMNASERRSILISILQAEAELNGDL